MSEIEVPLEKVHEDIHHAATHGSAPGFMNSAAITSALLAVVAAVSALFAGHYSNEAMIEQIQSSDQWAYYQAKGIKLALAEFRNETSPSPALEQKIEKYKEDQKEIQAKAEEKQTESREHLHKHERLAASVTFFQVAIGLTAIAVLSRKKKFLFVAAVLGLGGAVWMGIGFL